MADRLMKTVFEWEHFALYLSGSMDFAKDGGKGWREEWTEQLVNIGINPKQIYNPCKKPFNDAQFELLDDEAAIARECRKNEDWDKLDNLMSQIQHTDCRLVDKSDIVLVNFPRINNSHSTIKNFDLFDDSAIHPESSSYLELMQHATDLRNELSNMRIPTYGTIHEIVIAHQQRKPIFIVWEGTGKKDCSAWLMRLIGYQNVFSHVDELIKHLQAISQGKKSFNANEWLLLNPK